MPWGRHTSTPQGQTLLWLGHFIPSLCISSSGFPSVSLSYILLHNKLVNTSISLSSVSHSRKLSNLRRRSWKPLTYRSMGGLYLPLTSEVGAVLWDLRLTLGGVRIEMNWRTHSWCWGIGWCGVNATHLVAEVLWIVENIEEKQLCLSS